MFKKASSRSIASALRSMSTRLRSLEVQTRYARPEYTVAHGGFLIANSSIGATSVVLNTYPQWCVDDKAWILIDAGTTEAELRRASSVSDTTVSFTPALDYAHAEMDSVLFINEPMINVLWMGAEGDGTTDDVLPINRALIQFGKVGGRSRLYLPAGEYKCTSEILCQASCAIIGEGVGKTFISSSSTTYGIRVSCSSYGAAIKQLTLQGITGENATGIRFENSNIWFSSVEDVFVTNFSLIGIHVRQQTLARVTRCLVTSCDQHGIYIDDCERPHVHENTVKSCGYIGIRLYSCETSLVSGNYVSGCGQTTPAFYPYGISIEYSNRGTLHNNVLNDCKYYINIANSNDFSVLGNTMEDTLTVLAAAPIYAPSTNRLAVFGNIFPSWSSSYGVYPDTDVPIYNSVEQAPQSLVNATSHARSNTMYSEWLPAQDFIATSTSAPPTLTTYGGSGDAGRCWQFNATQFMTIGVWWRTPRNLINYDSANGFSIRLCIHWALVSTATSGNIRLLYYIYSGTTATAAAGYSLGQNTSGIGLAGQFGIEWAATSYTLQHLNYGLRIRVGRSGAHADDTCSSEIYIFGALLTIDRTL